MLQMYNELKHQPYGIPHYYMAQIQGQLAVCSLPWYDFMAICTKNTGNHPEMCPFL